MIIDPVWLEIYARYRERLLLGPEGPFSSNATELPCQRATPAQLRSARRGEPVPFLRWASEGAGDPFGLPGRLLIATRLLAVAATGDDLETSGVLGLEHGENLWQSGLAVLAFACEAIVTADGKPIQLATGIMRALRRLGSFCPGQGESTSPGNDGFGYMPRADAVDDTTTDGQGQRTSNFCDWLGGPNAARGLEPSASHYLGMLSGLVLARRALLASGGDISSAELISEIEARVRACQLFISKATAYWIRRNDGKDVLRGPLAFGVAWPLARLAAEISGNQPGQELANFHTAQLARALVEFDPSTNRAGLVKEILQSLGQALWSGFVPVLIEAISPDAVAILRNSFPDVWLKQVVIALRNTVDQFVIAQLSGSLPTKLAVWLDGDPLKASATGDLARSWWQHCLGRFLDPALAPGAFDALPIPLSHILGTDEIQFTAPTLYIQTPSDAGPVTWPPISVPTFRFRPGDQPFFLHLKASALSEEIGDLEGRLQPRVRIRRANNNTPGPELAPDAPGPVPSLAFSPAADMHLASGHWDGIIRLRDIQTGTEVVRFDGQGGPVQALAFTPDGQFLAAGLRSGSILIFRSEPPTVGQTRSLPGHPGGTFALACQILSDGQQSRTVLASGGTDRKLRLWDLQTGSLLLEWDGHAGAIRALTFVSPPNGPPVALLSAGEDGAARAWNPTGGTILIEAVDTGVPIHAMGSTPDGSIVATGGPDGNLRFWNLASGLELAVDRGLPGGITAIAFSADNQTLIAGTGSGMSQQYSLKNLKTGASDGFNRIDVNGPGPAWIILSGTWKTDGTRLVATSLDGEVLYGQSATASDYGVRAIVRSDLVAAGASNLAAHGILARVWQESGTLNGYQALLAVSTTAGTVQLWRVDTGTPTMVASANVTARIGTDHVLELIAQTSELSVLLDDTLVIQYTDKNPLGLDRTTQAGLSWKGDPTGDAKPRWDNFQVRPLGAAEVTTLEGTAPVSALAFSSVSPAGVAWLATATAEGMPSYPWRIAAVASANPATVGFDALACAARDDDAMLLALAHLFLGVKPNPDDDRFAEVMSRAGQAPPGFPHAGAANGWDQTFRWSARAGVTATAGRPNGLGNGLDLLAPTAIAAAADPAPENRSAFRKALLLGTPRTDSSSQTDVGRSFQR